MACANSKSAGICRLSGTVIRKIWLQIVFVGIYTTGLVCVDKYVDQVTINFPQTLIPVLGFVTGLLVVFRTNTAYDRYWEGRKLWSQITHNIRTLTRYVWVTVQEKESQDLIEKLSMINLLVAFPFAVKNYLRGNDSYDAEDLQNLIAHMPRIVPSGDNPSLQTVNIAPGDDPSLRTMNIAPGESNGSTKRLDLEFGGSSSSVSDGMPNLKASKRERLYAHTEPTVTNIPIQILLYFASYLNKLTTTEKSLIFINVMNSSLSSLSDAVSGLERISETPIPLAYAVHLKHTVWLYLLALPFQLIGILDWWTIPAVLFTSFALLGILDIASEIENPFGVDTNDLPLDQICDRIKREAFLTVGSSLSPPATWILTPQNHPLDGYNAIDLSKKNLEELHQLLAQRAQAFKVLNK